MLGGSVAMGFYAAHRSTQDIDIVISMQKADVAKFSAIFENAYCYEPSILEEIDRKGCFNVIDRISGVKIDFFLKQESEYHNKAFERKQKLADFGQSIWVESPEDLIIAKISWVQQMYSERQMNDVENLLRNTQIDREYIRYWIKNLRLKTFHLSI